MTFNIFKFVLSQRRSIFQRAFSSKAFQPPKEIKIETVSGQLAGNSHSFVDRKWVYWALNWVHFMKAKVWNESGKQTPILALHGWMDNAGTWDNLCPFLDKDYPVFALDLPGHGYSCSPSIGFGTYFMNYVVTLHNILQAFRWKQVILLGHSMGGDIALVYSGIMPAVVQKLIVLDTIVPLYVEAEKQPERTALSLAGLLDAQKKLHTEAPRYEYKELVNKLLEGYKGSVDEDAAKILLMRNSCKHEDGKYSFTFSPYLKVNVTLSMTLEQAKAYLSGIACDLLIVRAISSIRYIPREVAKEAIDSFRKTCKNFAFEAIEGTHHVHILNPEPVANYINNFLRGVPQSEANKSRSEDFINSENL